MNKKIIGIELKAIPRYPKLNVFFVISYFAFRYILMVENTKPIIEKINVKNKNFG